MTKIKMLGFYVVVHIKKIHHMSWLFKLRIKDPSLEA